MYVVVIKKHVVKEIQALSKKDQQRILLFIDILRENPTAGKKLEGKYKDLRSLRAWPYRIIYAVDHGTVTVTVVKVGHRNNVYQS